MSAPLTVFLRSVPIGVMVAAPVGAMSVLCVQRTFAHGPRRGLLTGAGIATADGLYASIAAFGLTAVSGALVQWQGWLRFLGGLFLVWMGVSALRRRASSRPSMPADERSGVALYGGTVLLTLTNPTTIVAFAAVFASAGIATGGALASAVAATVGVAVGSAAWWIALVSLSATVRGRAGDRFLGSLGIVSGSVLLAFGAFAALTGVRLLLGL